jgi:predicted O-methyltransferase YrrM
MNSVIERIYANRRVEDADGNAIDPFPDAIPYAEGHALYQLIRKTAPDTTVEIGMAYGLSTLFMCQALADNGNGRHIAIDPAQSTLWRSIGLRNIRDAKLDDRLVFHEAPSQAVLPRLLAESTPAGVVFIDGCHLFDYALVDCFYADQLLTPGGFLVLDDLWMPAVRKACGFILRNRQYRLAVEHMPDSPTVWQRGVRLARSVAQSPLDVGSLATAARLVLRGAVKYCVLQKMGHDGRPWDHYRTF